MKTALSVPDELFAEAEALAQRMSKSRSRLYSDAVREYVARHDPDAVTEALNRVYSAEDEATAAGQSEPHVAAAAARLLQRVEW